MYKFISTAFGIAGCLLVPVSLLGSVYIGSRYGAGWASLGGVGLLLGLGLVKCAEYFQREHTRQTCPGCIAERLARMGYPQSTASSAPAPKTASTPRTPAAPGITRPEIDSLKEKLKSVVEDRDGRLEEIAASSRPDAVKAEDAKAVLADYESRIASL